MQAGGQRRRRRRVGGGGAAVFVGISGAKKSAGPLGLERASTRKPMDMSDKSIGACMLRKMGWKVGNSLGRTGTNGITVPLDAVRALGGRPGGKHARKGLGHPDAARDADGNLVNAEVAKKRRRWHHRTKKPAAKHETLI